jgi:hypothetical protein
MHAISDSDGPPPPKPVIFHADHPFLYLIRDPACSWDAW